MRLPSVLRLAAGLLAVVTLAPAAASADPAQVEHSTAYGATASFASPDPANPCALVRIDLFLTTNRHSLEPGPPLGPYFDLENFTLLDTCAGTTLLNSFVSGTQFTFDTGPQLDWAHLTASVPVPTCDGSLCPAEGYVLDLDLTWTATGALDRVHDGAHVDFPDGSRRNAAGDGARRDASATGTATVGGATYPLTSTAARLSFQVFTATDIKTG